MNYFSKTKLNQLKERGNVSMVESLEKYKQIRVFAKLLNDDKILIKVSIRDFRGKSNTKVKQKTINNIGLINNTVETLVRASLTEMKPQKVYRGKGIVSNFKTRVERVPGVRNRESYGIRESTKKYLSQSTVDDMVDYFGNTIGRMYQTYKTFCVPDEQQRLYKSELIENIYKKQNAKAKNGSEKEKISNTVNDKWRYAEEVRQFCIKNAPEDGPWPEEPLIIDARTSVSTPELTKVLPYLKYIAVATMLYQACIDGIPEAFAGSGLVINGLRVGESTALRMGKFNFSSDNAIGRYYIDHQIDNMGNLTDELKNKYSYRYMFVYGLMKDIYELRRKVLIDEGYDENTIGKCYLGGDKKDPLKPIKKHKVSVFLKLLLTLGGCNHDEISKLESAVMGNIGSDSDHDISAHLFRRNFASLATNGGIRAEQVDYLLGHKNKRNDKKDYATWDYAESIIGKLNRCIFLGDLTSTINPNFVDIELQNEELELEGNFKYTFNVKEDGYIEGLFSTLEPNEEMEIELNKRVSSLEHSETFLKDDCESRKGRNILSKFPTLDVINNVIEESRKVWMRSDVRNSYLREEK